MPYIPPPDPEEIEWEVDIQGHPWRDARVRYEWVPEKLEMIEGKLFWSDEQRLRVLGLLLENCGAEAAVRMGDPAVWRQAIALLDDPRATLQYHLKAAYRHQDDFDPAFPIIAVRWYERYTMDAFVRIEADGTRQEGEALLLGLRRAAVEQARRESPAWRSVTSALESLEFSESIAESTFRQIAVDYPYESVGEGRWKALPPLRTETRWKDCWVLTDHGWRLTERRFLEDLTPPMPPPAPCLPPTEPEPLPEDDPEDTILEGPTDDLLFPLPAF